jgi:hypothetical protein
MAHSRASGTPASPHDADGSEHHDAGDHEEAWHEGDEAGHGDSAHEGVEEPAEEEAAVESADLVAEQPMLSPTVAARLQVRLGGCAE